MQNKGSNVRLVVRGDTMKPSCREGAAMLQQVIEETRKTLDYLRDTGMDAQMRDDYVTIKDIHDQALKQLSETTPAVAIEVARRERH